MSNTYPGITDLVLAEREKLEKLNSDLDDLEGRLQERREKLLDKREFQEGLLATLLGECRLLGIEIPE